ncbi:MAG: PD-(D/E)XK nuclease family transposase [Treponema sp.]|nr:PD-(D/E)XK nuclease family transposase [Treponema sp.]
MDAAQRKDKLGILDLLLLTKTNLMTDVEIQVRRYKLMLPRLVFYHSMMTTDQMKAGLNYDRIRRVLRLDQPLPETVGAGRTKLTLIFSDPAEKRSETAQTAPTRIGFLKGSVSVPSDFDTMGQEEITALFG